MAKKKISELLREKMEHKSNKSKSAQIQKPIKINEAHAILMGLKFPNDKPYEDNSK